MPHYVPFVTPSRCAYSTLLLHHPWPNGEEKDIVPEGVSATAHLRDQRRSGNLSSALLEFLDVQRKMTEAQAGQGKQKEGASDSQPDRGGDDDGSDDSDDDEASVYSREDEPENAEDLPAEYPTLPQADATGKVELSRLEFIQAKRHVASITAKFTSSSCAVNQLSSAEEHDKSRNPAAVCPYVNQDDIEAELKEKEESMEGNEWQSVNYRHIRSYIHPSGANFGKQLTHTLSGEGGTGKTKIIHSAVLLARATYGKTKSIYGPVLVVGPTGCAAYNAGGYTWQSALSKSGRDKGKDKSLLGDVSQETANKLQGKLAGVRLLIFDEFSMLNQADLVDIERRMRAGQTDPEKRKTLFGGCHVLFCGDFYQLPPVGGDPLYEPTPKTAVSQRGREIWMALDHFGELKKNFRFDDPCSSLAQLAPLARIGDDVPQMQGLLDDLNTNVKLTSKLAELHADEGALWIAPTNAECEEFNKAKTEALRKKGAASCRIWAKHTAKNLASAEASPWDLLGTKDKSAILDKTPKPRERYQGKGIGINRLDLCVGSRVRITRNLCTMLGLYQGALGTVVGFGYQSGVTPSAEASEIGKRNMETAASENLEPPLVFVKLDSPGDFKSTWESEVNDEGTVTKDNRGVVCISAIEQEAKISGTYTRWMHPLLLEHASTYHKAQGLTLRRGVVMKPPKISKSRDWNLNSGPELGLAYVGISRVTKTDGPTGLTLLGPLMKEHFTSRQHKRALIKREYQRLRSKLVTAVAGDRA